MSLYNGKKYHAPDYVLLGLFGFLLVTGIIMLSSAGVAMGYQEKGDIYFYLKRQIFFGLIPGLILLYAASKIDYRFWKKISLPALILSIGLLILVLIPGIGAARNGATRWINLGLLDFQPAEIVKISFLIYLAAWLAKRSGSEIKDFTAGFLPFILILGLITGLIVAQPDFGTMLIIAFTSVIVYFIGGAKLSHVLLLGLSSLGLLSLLIKFESYRMRRFTTFLHPEFDPQGIGYHINQAFLAIGSGGFWGRGFGQSRQKFAYLPEAVSDSIFAIMAEELGFAFCFILVFAWLWLFQRGLKMASRAPDEFGRLLGTGIISLFVVQALINIGAMTGVVPLTGVPLPFISAGGTSLVISLAAVGILINISKQTKEI